MDEEDPSTLCISCGFGSPKARRACHTPPEVQHEEDPTPCSNHIDLCCTQRAADAEIAFKDIVNWATKSFPLLKQVEIPCIGDHPLSPEDCEVIGELAPLYTQIWWCLICWRSQKTQMEAAQNRMPTLQKQKGVKFW